MKNILFLFPVLFVFLFCASCKKDQPPNVLPPDTLPPITQTGANTFGCKINGQVWVPYYPCEDTWWNGAVELSYNIHPVYSTGMFPLRFALLAGKEEDPFSGFLNLSPAYLTGPATSDGSYIYGTGNVADSMEINFAIDAGNYWNSYGNPNDIFQITKLDTVNNIISGIFSFTLYSSPSDSIIVTDGRFDLRIGQYSHCNN